MLQGKTDFNLPIRPKLQHDLMLRSYQKSATKPTTRQDGSSLVIGDLWRNTASSNLFDWEWNGLYWVSPPSNFNYALSTHSAPASNGVSQVEHPITFHIIQAFPNTDLLVEDILLSLYTPVATNNDWYFYGFLYYYLSSSGFSSKYDLYQAKNLIAGWNSISIKPNLVLTRNGQNIVWIQLLLNLMIPALYAAGVNDIYYSSFLSYRLIHP